MVGVAEEDLISIMISKHEIRYGLELEIYIEHILGISKSFLQHIKSRIKFLPYFFFKLGR